MNVTAAAIDLLGPSPAVDPAELREVQAAARGDGEAYARLVRRHQQAVGAYLWRFTRNRGQWEELVHDTFVEAYFSLPGFRGRSPLLHWLRKIATRVGYRYWKQQARLRRRPTVPLQCWDLVARDDPPPPDPEQAAATVHAMLGQLGPRDRLVLTLFYLEGCPVAQIAQLTGWSRTMVKVQAHRARNRLKKLLQNRENQP